MTSTPFCAAKDTFSPYLFPLQPLSFDRINEGHRISSNCPIFRLPIELLSSIVVHLDTDDLANLALVDRDCQQLARSAQFTIVYFSTTRQSLELITQIIEESLLHIEDNVRSSRKIGTCVRRLVVAPNYRKTRLAEAMTGQRYVEETGIEDERNVVDMRNTLLSSISSCLPDAFPNLELFQFDDMIPMPSILFTRLSRVRLRHLALDNFSIEDTHCDNRDSVAVISDTWSDVQSLRVTLSEELGGSRYNEQGATLLLLLTMLRAVAPSIENLMLSGIRFLVGDFVNSLPEFPRLRILHVAEYWKEEEDGSLSLRRMLPLHGPALRSLEALQVERIDSAHLIRLGRLPCLTRLVVDDYSLKNRIVNFAFLAANPQLELLSFTFPIKSRTLRDNLLPIIHASRFSTLRTLRLIFASTRVSRRAIAAIGLISSLEMLWISAGQQYGWQYNWFVDHTVLKEGLKGLQRLRELAFSRESYHCKQFRRSEQEDVRVAYYALHVLPPDVPETSVLTAEDEEHLRDFPAWHGEESFLRRSAYVWEKWHRGRMLDIAAEYIALFPRLAFMYLGEYPMEVVRERREISQVRKAAILSEERDSCLTLLNQKWGSGTR